MLLSQDMTGGYAWVEVLFNGSHRAVQNVTGGGMVAPFEKVTRAEDGGGRVTGWVGDRSGSTSGRFFVVTEGPRGLRREGFWRSFVGSAGTTASMRYASFRVRRLAASPGCGAVGCVGHFTGRKRFRFCGGSGRRPVIPGR